MKVLLVSNGFQPNREKAFVSIAVEGIVPAGGWVTELAPLLAAGAGMLAPLGLPGRWFPGAQIVGAWKKAVRARSGWQA